MAITTHLDYVMLVKVMMGFQDNKYYITKCFGITRQLEYVTANPIVVTIGGEVLASLLPLIQKFVLIS